MEGLPMIPNLVLLTDDELIASLRALVGDERRTVVAVLRHLNEFDRRRLAVGKGFPSLFEYCVKELKYAQSEAGRRIQVARAAVKFPILYKAIERGFLSLTVASILAPHLKWDNHRRLIRAAKGLSTREADALVASLTPIPAAPPEKIRILTVSASEPPARNDGLFPSLPEETPVAPAAPPEAAAAVIHASPRALSAETPVPGAPTKRVHFSFTGDEALLRDFERAKELSRHKWPAGHLEDVFGGAIKVLLDKIDPERRTRRKERARRLAAAARSRTFTGAVKAEVWARDGGRCVYSAADGRMCGARAGLQFDHIRPWARGGASDAANVRLLCRAHNDLEARRAFGSQFIDTRAARHGALRKGVKI